MQAQKALGYFREDPGRPVKEARAEGDPRDTLAEQNAAFLEFCKREEYQVAATFIDTAADGPARPGFRQLLDHLRTHQGAANVVIVSAVDRLGRDHRQAARSLFQLDGLGARIISLDGEPDPAASLIATWTIPDGGVSVGDRVREAMRKKAIRGEVLGRPPYGYKVGLKNRLEPVPDEAAVVRYIFRLYTREALGIRLIARRLNEEGFKTRRGGNWSMVTIRDILLNRAYLGTYTRFGVRVPGSHPAMIAPDDYRRVQDRMASRRSGGGKRNLREFLLSGIANCGYCGNTMIGVSRKQSWTRRAGGGTTQAEYRYYQCLSRTNQSVCDYHTRRAADLEEAVRADAAAGMERALAGFSPVVAVPPSATDEVEKLRARLRQLDRQLDQYMHAAAANQLSRERLRELSVELAQRQMETDDAIDQLEGSQRMVDRLSEQREARVGMLEALRSGWDSLDFGHRQALIREVVERVTVLDDSLQVQLKL